MIVIGLTGNIASGKSMAASHLKSLGAVLIDADQVAREVVEPQTPTWEKVKNYFGEEYFYPDGTLNRATLGNLVFTDKNELAKLEAITHPAIFAAIERQIAVFKKEGSYPAVVVEGTLLLEGEGAGDFDEIWLVLSSKEKRLQRLMARNQLTRLEAERRIQSQMPAEEKAKYADLILYNNDGQEAFLQEVENNWRRITGR